MTASRLFLVRHAQTASNVAQTLGAAPDDPLDSLGERQARAVAAHFAALRLPDPRVYTSPYRRAQQTAQAIAEALGVSVTPLDGVQEFQTGTWAGRPYRHLQTHLHEWQHADGTPGFPGGESLRGAAQRFQAALASVLEAPGTPIVVSHGGVLAAGLALLLKADLLEAWRAGRFTHSNAAVTELRLHQGVWRPQRLADQAHLPDELH
ncbi:MULTISPECIES: histidine phosphatase family protein [Deinococcus]|nr:MULTISPECIES: histidine phosphatase family protein [Deinococcus]MBI0445875.1 histidine phosphatase family protein [Deinococcus sp. DB0503]